MEVSSGLSDEADGCRRRISGQKEAGAENETGLRHEGTECKPEAGRLRRSGRAAEGRKGRPREVNVASCTEDAKRGRREGSDEGPEASYVMGGPAGP